MGGLLAQMSAWTLAILFAGAVDDDCSCAVAAAAPEDSASLVDVAEIDQLKKTFNAGAGQTRLIVLFSPTCPGCIEGTRLTQKWLDENPGADIQVYAVWLPMLPGDKRAAWKAEQLSDRRVRHYWDPGAKVVGRWFRDHVEELKKSDVPGADFMQGAFGNQRAAWDVYFLYGPHAKWGDAPGEIVSWGRPVFRVQERLHKDLKRLVGAGE